MYNKFPAVIFLGDLGSMIIGWFFAVFAFYFASQLISPPKILIPTILLALPILDLFVVIIRRFYNNNLSFLKRFFNIFKSDRTHIHHIIFNKFEEERKVVLFLCFLTFFLSIVSIIVGLYLKNLNYGLILIAFLFMISRKKFK